MGRKPLATVDLIRIKNLSGSGITRFKEAVDPVSRHSHASIVLGVVESGVREIVCGEESYSAAPGMVFGIPADTVHAIRHPEGPCSGVAVHCALDDVRALSGTVPSFAAFAGMDHLFMTRIQALAEAVTHEMPLLEQHGRLTEVLGRLQDRYAEDYEMPERRTHLGANKAKALMVERFAEPLSLAELAEAAEMNSCALSRAFASGMGMPPHEFLTFVRVRNARLLVEQGMELAEVAAACGFSDQSHMSRAFKAVLGMTPGQYAEACGE